MDVALFEKEFPDLTRHLGQESTAELVPLMHLREIPAGAVLIEDGAAVDAFMLILSGEFNVEVSNSDKSLLLGHLGKGKWVGEVSYFTGDGLSTAKVYAVIDSRVLELKHVDFVAAQNRSPMLASLLTQHFAGLMAGRLRNTNQVFEQLIEHKLELMLANTEAGFKQSWLKSILRKLVGIEG